MKHYTHTHQARQTGVVFIMALIMLVVISMLATFSIRGALSSEAVSGNVRTGQLAQQSAEVALRFCETFVEQSVSGGTATIVVTAPFAIQSYNSATFPQWQNLANWDAAAAVTTGKVQVIPASFVSQNGGSTATTFNRPPECMVEQMLVVDSAGNQNTTSTYIVTARGFGPEVAAADASRTKPAGSEVWMQSTIDFQ